ncbi:MAG: serine/threonine protein kinase [Phycisphaerae bacterium]|nr:serine/threonine protein kinase [Phycisphaerae bacterium]
MPTRSIPLLPGYEIIERIGRGAGAVISLARDITDGRRVAIKHIVRQTPEDDRFIAQAENEYEVARRFKHPYLRRCYDIVRVRKWLKTRQLLLIMEYVDGVRLEDHRPESLEQVVPIFKKVAEGLHELHNYGFAHADIKPNNILLAKDGGLKIIDFGQSCPLGHTKERVQGTPDYMAPEQVHRAAIDQRTDVFNLGATMYWVVTGKWFKTLMPVAPAASKKIAIEADRGNDPPHQLNPETPLPLSKLIMECCEMAKDNRPRDMREVLSRLEMVQHLLTRSRPRRARRSRGSGQPG